MIRYLLSSIVVFLAINTALNERSIFTRRWFLDPANILYFDSIKDDKVLTKNDLDKSEFLFRHKVQGSETVRIHPASGRLVMLDKFGNSFASQRPFHSSLGDDLIDDTDTAFRTETSRHGSDAEDARRRTAGSIAGGIGSEMDFLGYLGPGRPLGFGFGKDPDEMYVCDSLKGLLRVRNGSNEVTIVSNVVSLDSPLDPGAPVNFANDLAVVEEKVAEEGDDDDSSGGKSRLSEVVYFTTSTDAPVRLSGSTLKDLQAGQDSQTSGSRFRGFYDSFETYLHTLMSGDTSGRLLKYDRSTGKTHVLLNNLAFPNGVALSADGSYLAFAETSRLRILRFWISGPKAGSSDVLADRLPGFPDGIGLASDGGFWISLGAPTTRAVKILKIPLVRWILVHLPTWARPKVPSFGAVAKIQLRSQNLDPKSGAPDIDSAHGARAAGQEEAAPTPMELHRVLFDSRGSEGVSGFSSVVEMPGRLLFFGHVKGDYVSAIRLPNDE